jgi:hypothetical protein
MAGLVVQVNRCSSRMGPVRRQILNENVYVINTVIFTISTLQANKEYSYPAGVSRSAMPAERQRICGSPLISDHRIDTSSQVPSPAEREGKRMSELKQKIGKHEFELV